MRHVSYLEDFNMKLLFASTVAQPDGVTIIFASLHLGEAGFNLSVMAHKRNKNGLRELVSIYMKSELHLLSLILESKVCTTVAAANGGRLGKDMMFREIC